MAKTELDSAVSAQKESEFPARRGRKVGVCQTHGDAQDQHGSIIQTRRSAQYDVRIAVDAVPQFFGLEGGLGTAELSELYLKGGTYVRVCMSSTSN